MKVNTIKQTLFYILSVGISIGFLFLVIVVSWIGFDVKEQCQNAKQTYGQDCIESLNLLLQDNNQSFKARNAAIWALGQLGDSRALPALQSYYTGIIPEREPLDKSISQYELKKAIDLTKGGPNIAAWMWRGNLATEK